MRLYRLREVRPHQFGAIFQPVRVLAADHDALQVALAELAVVGVHPLAQLVQSDFARVQARHGGVLEPRYIVGAESLDQ